MSKRSAIVLSLIAVSAIALGAFLLLSQHPSVTSDATLDAMSANPVDAQRGENPVVPETTAPADEGNGAPTTTSATPSRHEPFVVAHRPDPFAVLDVAALIARAETDPEAQYVLALLVHECNLAATRAIEDSLDEKTLAKVRDRVASCAQLPPGVLARRLELLERAAESGFLLAQIDYVTLGGLELTSERLLREPDLAARFRANAVRFLQSAASRGSVDALGALANAYEDGVIVDRDPRMAYAYTYAISLTNKTRLAGMSLARLGRGMTPSDVEQAQRIGQGVFNRCCR